ncbi:MAG: 30S ribosomal protein S3, partial [Runella slithyformis]
TKPAAKTTKKAVVAPKAKRPYTKKAPVVAPTDAPVDTTETAE